LKANYHSYLIKILTAQQALYTVYQAEDIYR
jgi:hypothetical protein